MKGFHFPKHSWLPRESYEHIVREHERSWESVESYTTGQAALDYTRAQNQAMLLKFFLEQAFGSGLPSGKALRIIERDFGSPEDFSTAWLSEAKAEDRGLSRLLGAASLWLSKPQIG